MPFSKLIILTFILLISACMGSTKIDGSSTNAYQKSLFKLSKNLSRDDKSNFYNNLNIIIQVESGIGHDKDKPGIAALVILDDKSIEDVNKLATKYKIIAELTEKEFLAFKKFYIILKDYNWMRTKEEFEAEKLKFSSSAYINTEEYKTQNFDNPWKEHNKIMASIVDLIGKEKSSKLKGYQKELCVAEKKVRVEKRVWDIRQQVNGTHEPYRISDSTKLMLKNADIKFRQLLKNLTQEVDVFELCT
ncbi:MAG: hypothetical protein ACI8WT_004880 [Clostridium sp.]